MSQNLAPNATILNQPLPVDYLMRQGCSLLGAERIAEAQDCFRQALAQQPDMADAHFWLGASLLHQGEPADAETHLRQAIALNPRHADAHARLGLLMARCGAHGLAVEQYRQAIAISPKHFDAWCNMGLSLQALKQWEEAEQSLLNAISLRPIARVFSNLGNLLADTGREPQAEQCYRHAIALEPNYAPAHDNLGVLRVNQQRRAEAEAHFRQALVLNPDNAQAALNLAHLLLADGRLEEGWHYYEARYSPRLPGPPIFVPNPPFPQWRGESLAGKSILVWLEQGLGDELQFCRYLPVLKRMGASRVSFVCRPELHALFSTLDGVDELVAMGDEVVDLGGHDYWSFTMSLALCCQTTLSTIPAHIPYLSTPPERRVVWADRIPQDGFCIGVVWRGNPLHHNDVERSLPSLDLLSPLWSVPGVRVFSLQKGVQETIVGADYPEVTNLGVQLVDFADTAAVAEQMDLILCIDTSMAHLAGALGLPCWLMLPVHHTDWRWMSDRTDSPWYPTMRLWRQATRGHWADVVESMRQRLIQLVEGKTDQA